MRLNALAAFACIFLLAFAQAGAQPRGLEVLAKDGAKLGGFKASYALVIGESQYRSGWPKLPGVATDVQIVATALEAQGFSVTVKQDLGSDALKAAYEDFIDTYGLDEGHRLLFYYAGHGHTLKLAGGRDMGYIVPVDAPNPNEDANNFKRRSIEMQIFDTWAKRIEARHALFLFDSCFSGSIFAITRAVPANINEKTLSAVRQFMTSGSADETVPDRSVFREQFVAGIGGEADRNGDGYVTGAELGEFLDENVVNYSNASQHPQYGKIRDPALDKGDFVFAVPAKAAVPGGRPGAAQTAPSPAPVPPAKPGELMVTASVPGAQIYIDGEAKGASPLLVSKLPSGRSLKVEARSGDFGASVEVSLKPGELRELSISMERLKGNLVVLGSDPSLRLRLDGEDRGPIGSGILRDLPAGEHKLELEAADLYWSASVRISPEETARVEAKPWPVGKIEIEASSDATIQVRGSSHTASGRGGQTLERLPAGSYELVATGAGYEEARTRLEVRRGQTSRWTPWTSGYIEFVGAPSGSSYRLESRPGAAGPIAGRLGQVAPGKQRIALSAPGYREKSVECSVQAGKTARVDASLELLTPGSLVLPRFAVDLVLRVGGTPQKPARRTETEVEYAGLAAGLPLSVDLSAPAALEPSLGTRSLTLKEGERASLAIPSGRLELALPAEAWAAIVGGSGRIGLKPGSTCELPVGRYSLAAGGEGYEAASATIAVTSGKTVTWDPWTTGRVVVKLDPADAILRIEGLQGADLAKLPPGKYKLVAEKRAYRSSSAEFTIDRGQIRSISLKLAPFAPGSLELLGLPEGVNILVNGSPASVAGTRLAALPTGIPIKLELSDTRASSLDPNAASFELSLGDGESRSLGIASGRMRLPWVPKGSTLFLGSGASERELASFAESGASDYESAGLLPGTYAVSLRGSNPYSGIVTIEGGAGTMPSDYREAMLTSLSAEQRRTQAKLAARARRLTAGWISLGTGLLGAAGSAATYFLGAQAMEDYRWASEPSEIEGLRKNVETYLGLFQLSATLGGLGLGLSPILMFVGPDPEALRRSIGILDEQIRALGK